MIHFITRALQHLEAYIPLMQSLVWPSFIMIIVWIFWSHICACIEAIRKRIEAGGGIKAGAFELPAVAPATLKEQNNKLEEEATEEPQEENKPETHPRHPPNSSTKKDFFQSYMLAEDLVMKKLSSDLNLRIVRQVKAERGVKYIFDGVAQENGKFIAIEVKMLKKPIFAKVIVRNMLDRLNTYYTSLPDDFKNRFSLILALVVIDGATEDAKKQISFIRDTYHFPIHVVCYQFSELQNEFALQ